MSTPVRSFMRVDKHVVDTFVRGWDRRLVNRLAKCSPEVGITAEAPLLGLGSEQGPHPHEVQATRHCLCGGRSACTVPPLLCGRSGLALPTRCRRIVAVLLGKLIGPSSSSVRLRIPSTSCRSARSAWPVAAATSIRSRRLVSSSGATVYAVSAASLARRRRWLVWSRANDEFKRQVSAA